MQVSLKMLVTSTTYRVIKTAQEGGGIAQLLSQVPQFRIPVGAYILNSGQPMHEWEGKILPAVKVILHYLA